MKLFEIQLKQDISIWESHSIINKFMAALSPLYVQEVLSIFKRDSLHKNEQNFLNI